MKYDATFRFDFLPSNQLNTRSHWRLRAKEAKVWDHAVGFLSLGRRPQRPLERAKLTLVRHSAQPSDWDNLAASWKHPVDALVSCGILSDDSWDVIGMPDIAHEKAPQKKGFVTMRIQEL